MKRSKIKKMLCVLAAGLCLFGTALPVFAETVDFNVTYPGDIISRRAEKADDEQRFYATATRFSTKAFLYCTSYQLNNRSVKSNELVLERNDNPSGSASYKREAKPNLHYFMEVYSNVSGLNASGRYTP